MPRDSNTWPNLLECPLSGVPAQSRGSLMLPALLNLLMSVDSCRENPVFWFLHASDSRFDIVRADLPSSMYRAGRELFSNEIGTRLSLQVINRATRVTSRRPNSDATSKASQSTLIIPPFTSHRSSRAQPSFSSSRVLNKLPWRKGQTMRSRKDPHNMPREPDRVCHSSALPSD